MIYLRRREIGSLIAVTMLLAFVFVGEAWAPTKIAPTEAEPGHPITIIDTPEGRLVDGSVAVFTLNGATLEIPLRTHKPFKTAQGRLPLDIVGGDFNVSVRQPGGLEFAIGPFTVLGTVVPAEPSIEPLQGPLGTFFTITDPQGRIGTTDIARFYEEGGDPVFQGILAFGIVVQDSMTLTGFVPLTCPGVQNFVTVSPSVNDPARFGDLPFFITPRPNEPLIEPCSGNSGSLFTIADPEGRMTQTSIVIFYAQNTDPALGTPATVISVSEDGMTLTGQIPAVGPLTYYGVTVREDIALPSLFADLLFFVAL